MIIAGFDSRNVTAVMDGLEAKAIYLLLSNLSKEQYEKAAGGMNIDGFNHITPTDVAAYARHFRLVMQDIMEHISKKGLGDLEQPEQDAEDLVN